MRFNNIRELLQGFINSSTRYSPGLAKQTKMFSETKTPVNMLSSFSEGQLLTSSEGWAASTVGFDYFGPILLSKLCKIIQSMPIVTSKCLKFGALQRAGSHRFFMVLMLPGWKGSWQQLSALANARSPLRACGVAAKSRSFGTAICLPQPVSGTH